MLKKLLHLSVVLASAGSLCAWNPATGPNLLISGQDVPGQDLPLAVPGPDGSTFVSWLSWEDSNASLKLQLLDKDGAPQLGESGIYVSQHATPSWSSGYDITSDTSGNVYIAYSDKRNGTWQTYVYKIDSHGAKQWGDGVPVAENNVESCLNPKLLRTDAGNVVVAYQSLVGARNTIKITKLAADGSKAWGGMIELTGTNGLYALADAGGDSFYAVYVEGDAGNLTVMRYTANGEGAWEEPVSVDRGSAIVSRKPMVTADGSGGIVLSWNHAVSTTKVVGALQAMNRSGELLWPEPQYYPTSLSVATSPQGDIYVAYPFSDVNGVNLGVAKYDAAGEYLWDSPVLLDWLSYSVSIYGVQVVDGGDLAVVYRNASAFNEATIEYSQLDPGGNIVDTQLPVSMMLGDKGRGGLSYSGGRQLVLAWGDNGMADGRGSIYAQNIVMAEPASLTPTLAGGKALKAAYSHGALSVNADGEASVFDCSGSLMFTCRIVGGTAHTAALAPGVYILRMNGETVKFTVL